MSQTLSNFLQIKKYYTSYGDEILECLFRAEVNNIKINYTSDQLPFRSPMIKAMRYYSKEQGFSLATLHLGIHILDVYMDLYVLSENPEHQKLISLVCLLLAAKSEDLVPSIKDLLALINLEDDLDVDLRYEYKNVDKKVLEKAFKKFSQMYAGLEFCVFSAMDFNIIRPTCVSFINIFKPLIVSENDFLNTTRMFNAMGDLRTEAQGVLRQLLEVVVLDIELINVRPSKIAASIIVAVRRILTIVDVWNDQLEIITRHKIEELKEVADFLIERRTELFDGNAFEECDSSLNDDSGFQDSSTATDTEEDNEDVITRKQRKTVQDSKRQRLMI